MASEQTNGHGESRLDRLEGLVEVLVNEHIGFAEDHKRLFTSQVLLTGSIRDLTESQKRTDAHLRELADSQKRTDERLGELAVEVAESHRRTDERLKELAAEVAESHKHLDDRVSTLVDIVDDLIRKRPPQVS